MTDKKDSAQMPMSAEQVAYQLFRHIAAVEQKALNPATDGGSPANRTWILDTYRECLQVVQNRGSRSGR